MQDAIIPRALLTSPTRRLVMQNSNEFDNLLSSLYVCAADGFSFADFVAKSCDYFKAEQASFVVINKESQKTICGWAHGYPKGLISMMIRSNLIHKDEGVKMALACSKPTVSTFCNYNPKHDIKHGVGVFTRTWLSATGIVDCAVATTINNEGNHVILIMNRHKSQGVYDESIKEPLYELLTHLQRIFSTSQSTIELADRADSLTQYIEGRAMPSAMINTQGALVTQNESFTELIKRYPADIKIANGEMQFASNEQQAIFDATVLDMLSDQHVVQSEERLLIECSGRLPLVARLSMAFGIQKKPSHVIVGLLDPNSQLNIDAEFVMRIIKATDAEARVVSLLSLGHSPAAAAQALDLKENTVRSYIKSVLAKNDYHRQLDLINDINRLAQLMV